MNKAQLLINNFFGAFKKKEVYGSDWMSILRSIGKISKNDYYQGLVFSCVDIIAKKASSVPFVLVKVQKDDRSLILDEDDIIVQSHPIIDLLERPNLSHTWTTFSYLLYSYLAIHGESFLLPNTSLSGSKIKELFLLNPLNITIEKGTTNYDPIKKYRYSGGGLSREFNPEEVVPIIQPNPYDELRGVSPIQMAKFDIESELMAKKWNTKFFENGGSPSGIFKIATNDVTSFKRMESEIKSKYAGLDNAFKMFILNKDSDFKNITPSQRDMDFVNQMAMSEKRIHKIFKVPDIFLGDTEAAKYSNAEVAKRIFAESVILPMLTLVFDNLNTFLLPMIASNADVKLKFHNPVPEDRDYELKKLDSNRKDTETSLKYMLINEVREANNLKAIPEGNIFYDEMTSRTPGTVSDPKAKSFLIKASPQDNYENKRNVFMKRVGKRYSVKLKTHFDTFINAIAEKSLKSKKKKGVDEEFEVELYLRNIIPDTEQWRLDLAEIIILFGILAIDDSIDNSSESFGIGVDFNLVHEQAVKWLQGQASTVSNSVRDTLLNRAREVIARNMAEKITDIQKIKEELLQIFKDEEPWRIDRIIRTEMMDAYGEGTQQSLLAAGRKKNTWITRDPCPLCAMNKNVTVEIGKEFPSGHTRPTAHPHCECFIADGGE